MELKDLGRRYINRVSKWKINQSGELVDPLARSMGFAKNIKKVNNQKENDRPFRLKISPTISQMKETKNSNYFQRMSELRQILPHAR